MPTIHYNSHPIHYTFEKKRGLKNHYIIIKKGQGVILRGRPLRGGEFRRPDMMLLTP
jgi:hypothetical protein